MATIVTPAILQALFIGFRTEYRAGYSEAATAWMNIASTIPSSTTSNTYDWLGDFPDMREWAGERIIKSMQAHGYSIENKNWESSVGVMRPKLEDDQAGVYSPMFRQMGLSAARHPDKLIFGMVKDAHQRPCYDGQNFFDAEHPVYAQVDGTGSVVPVANYKTGSQADGPLWMLLDTSQALKPFVYQERKKPVFTSMTKLDDEHVFMKNEYRFGVDCRSNVGFGFWQQAYGSREALTGETFNAAIKAMQLCPKDGMNPMGINPTHLVVSPHHRQEALEIVKAERNAAGATNINRNAVEVLSTPWMA